MKKIDNTLMAHSVHFEICVSFSVINTHLSVYNKYDSVIKAEKDHWRLLHNLCNNEITSSHNIKTK